MVRLLPALAPLALVLMLPAGSAQDAANKGAAPNNVVMVTAPTPYWGYARGTNALHGLADLTRAKGDYLIRVQKASQEREAARQQKLQTRAKELEHVRWRRKFLWEMREEEAQRIIKQEITLSKERPALTLILSGDHLNVLLNELKKESRFSEGASVGVEQAWLDGVNFVSTGGTAGLLRQKALTWPVLLQEERFDDARKEVEVLLEAARKEARAGKVARKTVAGLLGQAADLDAGATAIMTSSRGPWSNGHHVSAMRFTKELQQTARLLEDPKEAKFLLGHRPRCKTVAELVHDMSANGLKFGPASAGAGRSYVALHEALVRESRRLEKARDR